MLPVRITLVGDYNPSVRAHVAACAAVTRAGGRLGRPVEFRWVPTHAVPPKDGVLEHTHGLWLLPGSPYQDMNGALRAIQAARESDVPFLGTCGGLQHAVLEFARNVMGVADAEHEETSPGAPNLFITRLACSLYGKVERVSAVPETRLHEIWPAANTEQQYDCAFAINPARRGELERGGLRINAVDGAGMPRGIELPGRRFFIATQFQPELNPGGGLHPLVEAFVGAASG